MTRELITELANTLERMDGWLKVRHFSGLMPDEIDLVKAAREYLATEPSDERATLINRLRSETWSGFQAMAEQAADMLEAELTSQSNSPKFAEWMTDIEAHQILLDMAANIEKFGDGTETNEQLSSECIRFILDRVNNYGIIQQELE